MFMLRACSAAAVTAVLLALATPAQAQKLCKSQQGAVACAPGPMAGGLFGRYQPPRYYRPYRQPTYAPPPAFGYPPYGEPAYQTDYPPELIQKIQSGLDYLGYNPGPVDGVFGGLTHQAITEFQDDAGLLVDGVPSPDLYASIARYMTGDPQPQ